MTAETLAVVDALHRYAAGIDQRDRDLLASSFIDDTILDFRPAAEKAGFEYPVIQGRDVIVEALMTSLATLDTSHSVANPRVTIDGNTATLEALVEAQHLPRQDHSRHYMMKNRYIAQMERQGGMWRIQHILIDNIWSAGDLTVLSVV